jgi:hypothetical protein
VNNTLIYSFVNKRNGRDQQLAAAILIVRTESRSKFLDLGSQFTAVTAIYRVSLDILSDSLFSGFMICHCLPN